MPRSCLGLADEKGFPHDGTINFIDNQVDMPTGTLRLRGLFPNPDRILSPGMFVRIQVPVGDPQPSLLVSEKALGSDQGKKFLYVVDDKDDGGASRRRDRDPQRRRLRVDSKRPEAGRTGDPRRPAAGAAGEESQRQGRRHGGQEFPRATAEASPVSPGVKPGTVPVIPTGTSGMPPPPRGNLPPPSTAKPAEEPRPGVKSAASVENAGPLGAGCHAGRARSSGIDSFGPS